MQGNLYTRIIAVILPSITLTLAAIDGYVARRRNMANAQGAVAVVGHTVLDAALGIVIDVEPFEPSWSRAAVWSRATA